MTTFAIEPYVGPLPIRFDMTPTDVRLLIGPPCAVVRDAPDNYIEERANMMFGYFGASGELFDATFSPGVTLAFNGLNLFELSDPIESLSEFDSTPYEWVGFIIFLKLGIRLSGFHDCDETQKAISVVRKGYWDEYRDDFVEYK